MLCSSQAGARGSVARAQSLSKPIMSELMGSPVFCHPLLVRRRTSGWLSSSRSAGPPTRTSTPSSPHRTPSSSPTVHPPTLMPIFPSAASARSPPETEPRELSLSSRTAVPPRNSRRVLLMVSSELEVRGCSPLFDPTPGTDQASDAPRLCGSRRCSAGVLVSWRDPGFCVVFPGWPDIVVLACPSDNRVLRGAVKGTFVMPSQPAGSFQPGPAHGVDPGR